MSHGWLVLFENGICRYALCAWLSSRDSWPICLRPSPPGGGEDIVRKDIVRILLETLCSSWGLVKWSLGWRNVQYSFLDVKWNFCFFSVLMLLLGCGSHRLPKPSHRGVHLSFVDTCWLEKVCPRWAVPNWKQGLYFFEEVGCAAATSGCKHGLARLDNRCPAVPYLHWGCALEKSRL